MCFVGGNSSRGILYQSFKLSEVLGEGVTVAELVFCEMNSLGTKITRLTVEKFVSNPNGVQLRNNGTDSNGALTDIYTDLHTVYDVLKKEIVESAEFTLSSAQPLAKGSSMAIRALKFVLHRDVNGSFVIEDSVKGSPLVLGLSSNRNVYLETFVYEFKKKRYNVSFNSKLNQYIFSSASSAAAKASSKVAAT